MPNIVPHLGLSVLQAGSAGFWCEASFYEKSPGGGGTETVA